MNEDDFGLRLILAEEQQQAPSADSGDEGPDEMAHRDTLVFEDTARTESAPFHLTPEDTGLEVPGPGMVDTVLIVADDSNFGVTIETGTTTLVDHSFTTLHSNSTELSHVAAYQRNEDDAYVVNVAEFDYRDRVSVRVSPSREVTFELLRAVYTLGEGVDPEV